MTLVNEFNVQLYDVLERDSNQIHSEDIWCLTRFYISNQVSRNVYLCLLLKNNLFIYLYQSSSLTSNNVCSTSGIPNILFPSKFKNSLLFGYLNGLKVGALWLHILLKTSLFSDLLGMKIFLFDFYSGCGKILQYRTFNPLQQNLVF